MPSDAEPLLLALHLITGTISLGTLFYFFQKHIAGQPLIAYQPRTRVPWNTLVGVFALSFPVIGIIVQLLSYLSPELPPDPLTESQPTLELSWFAPISQILLLLTIAFFVAVACRAGAKDFGLPASWKQALGDIGLGIVACLAAFLPVHLLQLVLTLIIQPETQHPIIEQLQDNPSTQTLLVAFTMAVIAAPLLEEFVFRCLLQGWLERYEDEVTGNQATLRKTMNPVPLESESLGDVDPALSFELYPDPAEDSFPEQSWITGIRHGYFPILISATLFGLAHLGHGVAPIPLILFGIVLGYLYQRTHRLLPCITAHMLFNAYTAFQLWLFLQFPPPS